MDYEVELEKITKQAGRYVLSVCKIGFDSNDFQSYLAKEMKIKSTGKRKNYDTIVNYFQKGIPKRYLLNDFQAFQTAIQKAICKCIENHPYPSERDPFFKKWEALREDFLIELSGFFFKMRNLEFSKAKRIEDPCDDQNILLVNFAFGQFPEEYISPPYFYDPIITRSQADMIRAALRPHLGKFYKGAQKEDEFAVYDARILAFCFKVWPEDIFEDVVLDRRHMEELRIALRQHSGWIHEKFCHNLPTTPDIWNGKSPEKLTALELSQGDLDKFKEYLKLTEKLYAEK